MKFQIKARCSSRVVYECELDTSFETEPRSLQLGEAIKKALESGSDLSGSNLRDSDLSGSDLSGSDLRDSDLSGSNLSFSNLSGSNLRDSDLSFSNLSGSNLRDSDLSGSDLSGSNLSFSNLSGSNLRDSNLSFSNLSFSDLSGSNLSGSNLRDSNLSFSNLSGSDLSGSDLSGSNLSFSNLSGSNLTPIRDDLWAVLSAAPREVKALRSALIAGFVDGSTYSGECSCLVGTIAAARKVSIDNLGNLKPNSQRPIERLFMSIKKGDTPETNLISRIVLDWVDEWLSNMQAAFGMQQ